MYEDVVDADGNVLSPGVPPGAEDAGDWAGWMLPAARRGTADQSLIDGMDELLDNLMRHDPDFDVEAFDPVADRDLLANATARPAVLGRSRRSRGRSAGTRRRRSTAAKAT